MHSPIDGIEHGARRCPRSVPRAFAHGGVGIEAATAGAAHPLDRIDVCWVVREGKLVARRVSPFDVR